MRYAGAVAHPGSAGKGRRLDEVGRAGELLLDILEFDDQEIASDYVGRLSRVLGSRGLQAEQLRRTPVLVPGLRDNEVRRLRSVTDAALAQLDQASALGGSKDVAPEPGETPAVAMARALLDGDRQRASELIAQAMDAGQSYGEAAVSVVQPAMYSIGCLWEQNLVTVAQEHLATGVARTALTQAFVMAAFAPEIERRVLLACVPGNRHSLGLRIVSDCFEIAGWQARFLGADVPDTTLLTQIRTWQPDLVGLSIAQVDQIATARTTIATVRSEFGHTGPRILVGGLATDRLGDAQTDLGADAWCRDALSAPEYRLG